MNLNPMAVAAILLTVPLFWVGMTLQRKTQSRLLRFLFVLVGIVIAVPGFLLVVYYTHLFDSARWFYAFRTSRFSEISVCGLGWIAGSFYSWLDPKTLGGKLFWPAALFAFVSVPFIKPVVRAFKQPIQPAVQRVQPAYCRLSAKMRRSSSWLANLLRPREERRSGISLGLFGGEGSERTLSFSLQIIFFPQSIYSGRRSSWGPGSLNRASER